MPKQLSSFADPAEAWLQLLPLMTPVQMRELLDEGDVALYLAELEAAGVAGDPFVDPASLEVLARVLVQTLGHPAEML